MNKNPVCRPGSSSGAARFDDDGRLRSQAFDDIYFSPDNGLAETRHVFIDGNDLTTRWQHQRGEFLLAELGFGTGLNFLASWAHWQQHAPDDARLCYIAVERYPLAPATMARALASWSCLAPLCRSLLAQWPRASGGSHQFEFLGGRVRLLLLFDDVVSALADLAPASVNAWYLDGFAPARNPQMWSDAVLRGVRHASAGGATLATFTAAGFVRRGLQSRGFIMQKRPGFGRKREMLVGRLADGARLAEPSPGLSFGQAAAPGARVAVVGAGIAGASTALALSRRGFRVSLLEAGPEPGHGASGNPAGALYPLITADGSRQSRISLMAFDVTRRWLTDLEAGSGQTLLHRCGVLLLGFSQAMQARYSQAVEQPLYAGRGIEWLEPQQASQLAGVALEQPGLWLPQAGWVAAGELCRLLVEQLRAEGQLCLTGFQLESMHRQADHWCLRSADGREVLADQVILATGAEQPAVARTMPLSPVRGAISLVEANELSRGLRCVLCHKGYLMPADGQGQHLAGARYDRNTPPDGVAGDGPPALQPGDHQEHLALLKKHLPQLDLQQAIVRGGRGSWRMTTPDRMPVAGPLPDVATAKAEYAGLAKGPLYGAPDLAQQPGLWIHGGHGSRGLTHAMLCAEVIADAMAGRRVLMPEPLRQAIHPARFLLREIKRHQSD